MPTLPISLIVPVYNERRGLPPTVERLRALLTRGLPAGSEVILVDDGSTDGTSDFLARLAEDLPPGFRLLGHRRNRGYGAALKTGIRAATHETIAIADADGTYPLERIPELVEAMEQDGAAMAVGTRPVAQQPAVRRPAKAVLRALAEYLTGETIPDLNSGLRVFRRRDALRLSGLLPDGFSFTTTITMALLTEGEGVLFIPIRYKTRVGSSKIRPIRDTANFLLLICRTALAFNPLKVFGPVGLGLIGVGLVLLALRMLLDNPVGVASTIIFLVGGLQVLALGLLADLVNRRGPPRL
jgi:glycosyltransferase involved in cell wall biosynthesis